MPSTLGVYLILNFACTGGLEAKKLPNILVIFPSNIFPTCDIETISESHVEWIFSQYQVPMLVFVKIFWYQVLIWGQCYCQTLNRCKILISDSDILSMSICHCPILNQYTSFSKILYWENMIIHLSWMLWQCQISYRVFEKKI